MLNAYQLLSKSGASQPIVLPARKQEQLHSSVRKFQLSDSESLAQMKQDISRILKSIKYFCNDSSSSKREITIQVLKDIRERSNNLRSVKLLALGKPDQPDSIVIQRLKAFDLAQIKHDKRKSLPPKLTKHKSITETKKKQKALKRLALVLPPGLFFDVKINFSNRLAVGNPGRLKVYIGEGNNSTLVKAVLRKRKKVGFATKMECASFVWTQLLDQQTIQRQPSNQPSRAQKLQHLRYLNHPDSKILSSGDIDFLQENCHFAIGGEEGLSKLKEVVLPQVRPLDCRNLLMTNHLQFGSELGDKKNLFKNLKQHCSQLQLQLFDIVPRTFWISSLQDSSFREFRQFAESAYKTAWIVKPGENSNRGSGIFLAGSPLQLLRELKGRIRSHSFIVQEYMQRPFLYQQRKFDIRHFMLLTSINGRLKGYWYNEGYIRTSSRKFSMDKLDDMFVHLTNDAIQKNCSEYGMYQPGNKVSYQVFEAYLESKQSPGLSHILKEMKRLACICLEATGRKVDPSSKQANFQLFGLDFMLDRELKPWLIEVNTNPCLQTSCAVLSKLIPKLLDSTFRLALDPVFGSAEGNAPVDLGFQLIFQA